MRQHDRHLNLAARSQHLERHFLAVTANPQVNAGRPELQVAQYHLVEKLRQARIARPDLAARGIEFETERRLQQRKGRRTRPGLRSEIKKPRPAAIGLSAWGTSRRWRRTRRTAPRFAASSSRNCGRSARRRSRSSTPDARSPDRCSPCSACAMPCSRCRPTWLSTISICPTLWIIACGGTSA